MWTADIDVGGTLTDGLFTNGERVVAVKVDTTAHDLTVCLFDCMAQAAAQLEFADTMSFLENVGLIRWSTTITSNVLAEQRGPRIGVLVSRGHERDLYGSEAHDEMLRRFVNEGDVIGVDPAGSDTEIMNAARSLLERGVRRICVSLEGAGQDSEREKRVKRIIDQQYPDHFLGSVPVLAGSDISKSPDDRTRTYCAAINAYTHGALAATLFKAEDELRETQRYTGTFLVSHINGGVAGIAKTKAIDTIESGPVLGILGSAHLAKQYGFADVVAMDIGGTTAKVSLVQDGAPIYRKPADLFGIPLKMSLPYLRSIALGGGSVVKPAVACEATAARVRLGPESMGAYPGPACYGLGGEQATLTDAFVTAGLINPDYFLAGAKPISRELARKAVEESVARPLGISVEEACRSTIEHAFELVANLILSARQELQLVGQNTLFAYGGNGGLFACGVAERAGIDSVRIFSLGPVFSAFGSSVSDICHVYERAVPETSAAGGLGSWMRRALEEIRREASQDLLGEGIGASGIVSELEFDVTASDGRSRTVAYPETAAGSGAELDSAWSAALGPDHSAATIAVRADLLRVRVKKPMPKFKTLKARSGDADRAAARIGSRQVGWGSRDGEAQVYRWESLQPGNRLEGCAVLEGLSTTYFVPDRWALVMDPYGNAALHRK
jgi:N-methylhydantoinase A/oxoprolinase/acetone carboxylase beta subunit